MNVDLPSLGYGVGLRRQHFKDMPTTERRVDFLEFTPENFMAFGGRPIKTLEACGERWPLVAHSVNMNLGGMAELDSAYLDSYRKILNQVNSRWFGDHLCWTASQTANTHELLPLPFTREAVQHVVKRIQKVKAFMRRPMTLENISTYARMPGAEMTAAAFLTEVLEGADCYLLLDVNNVYVNAINHGEDAEAFLNNIPLERVLEVHMAGHEERGDLLIDTHGRPVRSEVWDLYKRVIPRLPRHSIVIERDSNIPTLGLLLDEADLARSHAESSLQGMEGLS